MSFGYKPYYFPFCCDSLTEVYVKVNSEENVKSTEKHDIRNPSYIDSGPPPYTETARMARYIVHNSGRLYSAPNKKICPINFETIIFVRNIPS